MLSKLIFALLLTLLLFSDFAERVLFLNEVLSLLGFLAFIHIVLVKKGVINKFEYVVLPFVGITTVCALFSLLGEISEYYFLRHLSLIYSVFTYYIGYLCAPVAIKMLRRKAVPILYGAGMMILFSRLSAINMAPLVYGKEYLLFAFFLAATYFIDGGTHIIIFAAILFGAAVVHKRPFWVIFGCVLFAALAGFFLYLLLDLSGISAGGNTYLAEKAPFLYYDPNTGVRVYLWLIAINAFAESNALGIGFGTPLFADSVLPFLIGEEGINYLLGPHNSFLWVLARTGILGFSALIFVFYFFLATTSRLYQKTRNEVYKRCFYCVIAVIVSTSLHVVLESPVRAASTWAVLGFIAAVLSREKSAIIVHSQRRVVRRYASKFASHHD